MSRARLAEILIWILTAFFVVMMFAGPVTNLRARLAVTLPTSPP
jgi:hypothetical protein